MTAILDNSLSTRPEGSMLQNLKGYHVQEAVRTSKGITVQEAVGTSESIKVQEAVRTSKGITCKRL